MPLTLVATPIGNDQDLSPRAQDVIRKADLVIGEEHREVTTLLKRVCGETRPPHRLLNEHSTPEDVEELVELCRTQNVVLVSDCGTPGFCDPGANLVAAARALNISVSTVPGPSALMALIAVSGLDLRQFVFAGFLSPETSARKSQIQELKRELRPVILMDTPYRLGKLLSELASQMPSRRAVLACNLTQENENISEGPLQELANRNANHKAEFMMILHPNRSSAPYHAQACADPNHRRRPPSADSAPGRRSPTANRRGKSRFGRK